MLTRLLNFITLAGIVAAAPTPTFQDSTHIFARSETAASIIAAMAPSSTSCAGAPVASECATSTEAAPFLISAFSNYSITSAPVIAAMLSVVVYETGELQYNRNHFPGNPGQGTRNMQMANYNLEYANSLGLTTLTSTSGMTDDQLNAVLDLVLPDEYSYGSVAWFLTTQCASAIPALETQGQSGYEAYLACVGTSATSDRLAYWTAANKAMGIS